MSAAPPTQSQLAAMEAGIFAATNTVNINVKVFGNPDMRQMFVNVTPTQPPLPTQSVQLDLQHWVDNNEISIIVSLINKILGISIPFVVDDQPISGTFTVQPVTTTDLFNTLLPIFPCIFEEIQDLANHTLKTFDKLVIPIPPEIDPLQAASFLYDYAVINYGESPFLKPILKKLVLRNYVCDQAYRCFRSYYFDYYYSPLRSKYFPNVVTITNAADAVCAAFQTMSTTLAPLAIFPPPFPTITYATIFNQFVAFMESLVGFPVSGTTLFFDKFTSIDPNNNTNTLPFDLGGGFAELENKFFVQIASAYLDVNATLPVPVLSGSFYLPTAIYTNLSFPTNTIIDQIMFIFVRVILNFFFLGLPAPNNALNLAILTIRYNQAIQIFNTFYSGPPTGPVNITFQVLINSIVSPTGMSQYQGGLNVLLFPNSQPGGAEIVKFIGSQNNTQQFTTPIAQKLDSGFGFGFTQPSGLRGSYCTISRAMADYVIQLSTFILKSYVGTYLNILETTNWYPTIVNSTLGTIPDITLSIAPLTNSNSTGNLTDTPESSYDYLEPSTPETFDKPGRCADIFRNHLVVKCADVKNSVVNYIFYSLLHHVFATQVPVTAPFRRTLLLDFNQLPTSQPFYPTPAIVPPPPNATFFIFEGNEPKYFFAGWTAILLNSTRTFFQIKLAEVIALGNIAAGTTTPLNNLSISYFRWLLLHSCKFARYLRSLLSSFFVERLTPPFPPKENVDTFLNNAALKDLYRTTLSYITRPPKNLTALILNPNPPII